MKFKKLLFLMLLLPSVAFADLGDNVELKNDSSIDEVAPVSVQSVFVDTIDAGGMDDTDNATARITAISQIDGTTRHIIELDTPITSIALQLAYDDSASSLSTAAVVQAFGQGPDGEYYLLTNSDNTDGELTLTPIPADDFSDGTLKYTTILAAHKLDLLGADKVLIGVKTALSTNGDDTLAKLRVRGY